MSFYHLAMSVIGLNGEDQKNILQLVAAILHLGNVTFVEERNFAKVENEQCKGRFALVIIN